MDQIDKYFRSTIVNQALPSFYKWSLEIPLTIPSTKNQTLSKTSSFDSTKMADHILKLSGLGLFRDN